MTPFIINFPRLHAELTPDPKPENLVFLASALFQNNATAAQAPLVEAIRSALPLPLEEAQRNARQLQDFGADLWDSRQLETLAAISQSKASTEHAQSTELQEIKNFIASQGKTQNKGGHDKGDHDKGDHGKGGHGKEGSSPAHETLTNVRIGKELTLCIAYELEQAILETQVAIEKLGRADAAFRASLHTDSPHTDNAHTDNLLDDTFGNGASDNTSFTAGCLNDFGLDDADFDDARLDAGLDGAGFCEDDSHRIMATVPSLDKLTTAPDINLPYLTILEAMLPFLPDDVPLFCNDKNTLEALHETGMLTTISSETHPETFPGALSEALSEGPLQGQGLFSLIRLPAWQLLNHKQANPALPWTQKTVQIWYPAPVTP